MTAGREGEAFKGSMENLDGRTRTPLERTVHYMFSRSSVSEGDGMYLNRGPDTLWVKDMDDRMYLKRGPDTLWVKDTDEQIKLSPKYQLASESNNVKGDGPAAGL